MKKILLFLGLLFILVGCGKNSEDDVYKTFANSVNNCKGYHMTGSLEIIRNENKYTYDIDSSYQKSDYFKVSLTNRTNNHEQIILKNDNGVYVVTPNLNKSFKFQSEWPYNNSQIYLLQPLVTDLENDDTRTFKTNKNGYVFTTKVNYTNDKELVKQKIYFDKDIKLTKVEVLNNNDEVVMKLKVKNLEMKATFDDKYFDLGEEYYNSENSVKDKAQSNEDSAEEKDSTNSSDNEKSTDKTQETSLNNESLYPMYVPSDTYLSSQDVVKTDDGERTIMTFAGESPFILVQEAASTNQTTDYVSGDPYLILDTVGAITDYSVSWINNNTEYYVVSDVMDIDELLTVAESINVITVGK